MNNGLKYSPTNSYGFTQGQQPLNNIQAFQGYRPQSMAVANAFAPPDYSVVGGTPPAQFGSFNAGGLRYEQYAPPQLSNMPAWSNPIDGNYTNAMDMASDAYGTSKLANIGGLQSGQTYGVMDKFGDSLKSFFGGAVGTREAPGWGGLALSAAGGLASTYMGMKQYGLAKDSFDENKRQYAQNFDAQRGLTNSRLEDRQIRRNIERPDSMAAAEYMSKYGVK